MKDIYSQIMTLKRPPLLVRAARFGIDDYIRSHHLSRCLNVESLPNPAQALVQLLDLEKQWNNLRLAKSGNYTVARHVEILITIMAEARLFRAGNDLRLVTPPT